MPAFTQKTEALLPHPMARRIPSLGFSTVLVPWRWVGGISQGISSQLQSKCLDTQRPLKTFVTPRLSNLPAVTGLGHPGGAGLWVPRPAALSCCTAVPPSPSLAEHEVETGLP